MLPPEAIDARIKLFTPFFIDLLQQRFFPKESAEKFDYISHSLSDLKSLLPSIYSDTDLIKWGLQYLESKEIIRQLPFDNRSFPRWELTDQAVNDRLNEKTDKELNRKIDLEIKRRTLDQMRWQRWPMKYWYLVAAASILLTAVTTTLLESPKSQEVPSLSKQAIQALIDSSVNRKIHP